MTTYDALKAQLDSYGLGSLAAQVLQWTQDNPLNSADVFQQKIRDTPEYKIRFAGNEARLKAGLPVLSEADYLNMERGYKSAMKNFGMPASFYDQPGDFTGLIGSDVSIAEVNSRAQDAWDFTNAADPSTKKVLKDMYGVTDDAQIAAYFLDPEKGQALIDKQAGAVRVASIADRNGLQIGANDAERLSQSGLNDWQFQGKMGQAGTAYAGLQAAADRAGTTYSASDAVWDFGGNDAAAAAKRKAIVNNEDALFANGTNAGPAGGTTAKGSY